MTDQDFEFIRNLLHARSSIFLEGDKKYLLETRLTPVAQRQNLASVAELIGRMRTHPSVGLHTQIVEALVTTETSFFRDIHPFEALRKTVIPELIRARSSERKLNIWCAACSSGQEPYSIAMLLREHFPELLNWQVKLLATDLSREILNKASAGKYNRTEINRGLPAALLVKYFQQHATEWQINENLRRSIEFRELNLAKPWPLMPRMDLIFIRNVMIYFEVATKKAILAQVRNILREDGYLVLGSSETTMYIDESFRRVEQLKSGFFQVKR